MAHVIHMLENVNPNVTRVMTGMQYRNLNVDNLLLLVMLKMEYCFTPVKTTTLLFLNILRCSISITSTRYVSPASYIPELCYDLLSLLLFVCTCYLLQVSAVRPFTQTVNL